MTISPNEAGAMLADVEAIVARVKQTRLYHRTGQITILWGVIIAVGQLVSLATPRWALWEWRVADAIGVAATVVLIARARAPRRECRSPCAGLGLSRSFSSSASSGAT